MKKLLIPLIAAVAIFSLGNVQAVTISWIGADGSNLITTGGAFSVGTIINGTQAGGQVPRDVAMVNNLRTLLPNVFNSGFGDGNEYHRSGNAGPYPMADATGAVFASAGGITFAMNGAVSVAQITLTTAFQYLVAAYDGPNGGVIVYDVSSFAAGTVIEIPRFAQPFGAVGAQTLNQDTGTYQMTGWTLLNPTGTTVPDGGSAIALLGVALIGIEGLRRKLRSAAR